MNPTDHPYSNDELQELWGRISSGEAVHGWPSGRAFEYLVLRAFELEGADVAWPFRVDLDGEVVEEIDGAVYCEGLACLIEAKHWNAPVGFEPIAKLRNQLLRRPSSAIGVVFGIHGFTEPAKTLTRFTLPQTVPLWEGAELEYALRTQSMRAGLLRKYRYAVERGIPDFNISEE